MDVRAVAGYGLQEILRAVIHRPRHVEFEETRREEEGKLWELMYIVFTYGQGAQVGKEGFVGWLGVEQIDKGACRYIVSGP